MQDLARSKGEEADESSLYTCIGAQHSSEACGVARTGERQVDRWPVQSLVKGKGGK